MNSVVRHFPNLLSVSRVILIIPFISAIKSHSTLWLYIITVVIMLTDYFDGYFARKLGSITAFGKILDPLADKICVAAAALALVKYMNFPSWLLLLIIGRDIIILSASIIMIKIDSNIPISNTAGKITTGAISACLAIFLFNIDILKNTAIALSILMIAISLASYARLFISVMKKRDLKP